MFRGEGVFMGHEDERKGTFQHVPKKEPLFRLNRFIHAGRGVRIAFWCVIHFPKRSKEKEKVNQLR